MAILCKAMYSYQNGLLSAFPFKIPKALYLVEMNRAILKFIWNCRALPVTKTLLGKNQAGGITLPDSKTYYNATVIKRVWNWPKYRHRDPWKNPEIPGIHHSPTVN